MNAASRLGDFRSASSRPIWAILIALLIGVIAAVVLRLLIGGAPEDPALWSDFLNARLWRIRSCVILGVALAISGVALQVLLRNPLAEPFILGLSSGAGVGVMTQTLLAHLFAIALGPRHIGALVGALVSMLIVCAASRRRSLIDPLGLLLVGIVLSTINGAVIMLLNYMAGPGGVKENLAQWMMGYLSENIQSTSVWLVGGGTFGGLALLLYQARAMDVATFSDSEAQSLGVNLLGLRNMLFFVASVLAAGAMVLAGPIAFVGLISPHLARLLLGPGHRLLLIGSAMIGVILLLLADSVSAGIDRVFGLGIMPLGIFTAILGGPVFLWMLRPHLGRTND